MRFEARRLSRYFPPPDPTPAEAWPSAVPQQKVSLFDIDVEALAVDGPVEQAGRRRCGRCARRRGKSRSSTCPAGPCRRGALACAQPRRQVILVFVQSLPPRRGFIDEDQPPGGRWAPDRFAIVCGGDLCVGAILLACDKSHFLTVTPIRLKKRLIIEVSARPSLGRKAIAQCISFYLI